jgi:hypothetical protein
VVFAIRRVVEAVRGHRPLRGGMSEGRP